MNRTLYYHQQSSFSRKIRIFIAEKKLQCEFKEVDLKDKSPEFMNLSPIGKVPVFVEADGTVIWDSTLIAEYLDKTYPEPTFYPTHSKAKLECRKWEELADYLGENIINLWITNLNNQLDLIFYKTRLENSINRILTVFDQQLTQSKYLLSDETWTAADIAALCSLGYYSLRLNEDWLWQYKNLKNWFTRLHERESVQSTVPISYST